MRNNVLFLNPTRRIELINFFQGKCNIHIACYDELDPCMHLYGNVLLIKRTDYINSLIKYCLHNNVKLIIPWLEDDIMILIENYNIFKNQDIELAIGTGLGTRKSFSKLETIKFMNENYMRHVPKILSIGDISKFPVVLKPDIGSGSYGVKIINDYETLSLYKNDDSFVTEYFGGPEYTVDVFCTFGKAICCIPRKRIKHRAGECLIMQVEKNLELINAAKEICNVFNLDGVNNIQFIYNTEKTEFICSDINARVSGGITLSIKAGVLFPNLILDYYLNKSINEMNYSHIEWDLIGTRWQFTEVIRDIKQMKYREKNIDFNML